MPLQYFGGGVVAEHAAVRTAGGLFHASHLGKDALTAQKAAGAPYKSVVKPPFVQVNVKA